MKKHSTKRALLASVLALCMCFTMLVGTTFAWFTDTASSEGNVIKTGTLKIGFDKWDGTAWVDATTEPVFNYDKWEPGYTQIVNLRVTNLGNLAIAWKAAITTEKNLSELADVIYVYVKSDDTNDTVKDYIDTNVTTDTDLNALADAGEFTKFTLRDFVESFTTLTKGTLKEGQESYLGLVLQMDPDAGNEYQGLDLGGKFDITILATQAAAESDSNGNQYDAGAEYPTVLAGYVPVVDGQTADYTIDLTNPAGGKNGSVTVPAAAVADEATGISASVIETALDDRIAVGANKGATTLEIKVNGIVPGSGQLITVDTHIEAGLTNLVLYHETTVLTKNVDYTYAPDSGHLIIKTTNFSPFTYVYDALGDSVAMDPTDTAVPVAIVTDVDMWENVAITWNDDLGLMPNNANQTLESVYMFKAPHTKETVQNSAYAGWHCDFYVMIDREIPDGGLVLGGNYGTWGWVGFNSPADVPVNEWIPLLGSVTQNPWTYEQVVAFVGEFICGVAHTDHALDGATFSVALRLTNPFDEEEYYDVNTVTYTFPECKGSQEDLNAAITNGEDSITLSSGDYKMPGVGNGGNVEITGTKDTVIDLGKTGVANATFNGVTIKSTGYYGGIIDNDTIVYNNCTIDGKIYLYGEKVVFNNCTFDLADTDDYIWVYAAKNVEFNNCTFNTMGKALLIFQDGSTNDQTVKVEGCTFNASAAAYNWNQTIHIAAVSMDGTQGGTYNVILNNNTVDSDFNGLWQDKTNAGNITVTVDGTTELTANQ